MKRLTNEQWRTVFNNMKDLDEIEIEEFGDWVEIVWLEGEGKEEWILSHGYECFEDGFKTENEAQERLKEIEITVLKQTGIWEQHTELIEAVNSKGYVVKLLGEGLPNQFGKTHNVLIEGGQYRITFITNVFNGSNYCKIVNVTDYLKGRSYNSPRYHLKFISLISEINGITHIALRKKRGEL